MQHIVGRNDDTHDLVHRNHHFGVGGEQIGVSGIQALVGNLVFTAHLDAAVGLGFELNVKRAKIGRSKHIRVRPMFRDWELRGSLSVLDAELSGINKQILTTILNQAGAVCGLCDWRPSCPSSGTFGKFVPKIRSM